MDTPAGLPSRHQVATVRAGEDGFSALSCCIPCIEPELSLAPKPLVVAPRVSLSDLDLAGHRSHDKADHAASRGQPRGARALSEQRSRSSCSFAMAASMSRPAASLPCRRARRRHAAAPPWQHGARRRLPPRRQTSPPSGTGQLPSDPTLTPIPDLQRRLPTPRLALWSAAASTAKGRPFVSPSGSVSTCCRFSFVQVQVQRRCMFMLQSDQYLSQVLCSPSGQRAFDLDRGGPGFDSQAPQCFAMFLFILRAHTHGHLGLFHSGLLHFAAFGHGCFSFFLL